MSLDDLEHDFRIPVYGTDEEASQTTKEVFEYAIDHLEELVLYLCNKEYLGRVYFSWS